MSQNDEEIKSGEEEMEKQSSQNIEMERSTSEYSQTRTPSDMLMRTVNIRAMMFTSQISSAKTSA